MNAIYIADHDNTRTFFASELETDVYNQAITSWLSSDDFPQFSSIEQLAGYLRAEAVEIVGSFDLPDNELVAGLLSCALGQIEWDEIAETLAEDYPEIIDNNERVAN